MTKVLQELLTNNEPLFSSALAKLETSTGNDGVDLSIISDVTHKAHEIMRMIGLDPADTTARELYLGLNAYVWNRDDYSAFIDADYVLLNIEGEIVSFNIIDIIENLHHELSFDERTRIHAQRALRGEIVERYLGHPKTDDATSRQHFLDAGVDGEQHIAYEKPVIAVSDAPHILAIGDIFTDAFIKLDEKYAKVEKDADGNKWLQLPFGQKPPYERVDIVRSVGPSPNAAVSMSRIGLKLSLMAWLGDDEPGKESLKHLASEGVDTSQMITEAGKASSYWYVLRYQADRTMLVKSETYSYVWKDPEVVPDWIYLAYIGADSWPLHEELLGYLEKNPNIKFVFQPATYHFEWGTEKLRGLYKRAHLVVMNREEAVDVTGKSYDSIRDLANGLHELGAEKVVITDGPNGSYASYDGRLVTIPNYPDPAPPVDRTGAGDAFASTIVAALAQGESMDTALTWAPINSASVVQKVGAQAGLLHKDEILGWLEKAPVEYKVTDLKD